MSNDTRVGPEGLPLSGGQIQRLGLARAFLGRPRILILDEPNSNLDAAGEEVLIRALAALRASGSTVIVMAHRPSVLAMANKVLVLHQGRVVKFGPKDEILPPAVVPPTLAAPVPAVSTPAVSTSAASTPAVSTPAASGSAGDRAAVVDGLRAGSSTMPERPRVIVPPMARPPSAAPLAVAQQAAAPQVAGPQTGAAQTGITQVAGGSQAVVDAVATHPAIPRTAQIRPARIRPAQLTLPALQSQVPSPSQVLSSQAPLQSQLRRGGPPALADDPVTGLLEPSAALASLLRARAQQQIPDLPASSPARLDGGPGAAWTGGPR